MYSSIVKTGIPFTMFFFEFGLRSDFGPGGLVPANNNPGNIDVVVSFVSYEERDKRLLKF